MTKQMPATPQWLKAEASGKPIGVDTENNRINGYVLAQAGHFKTPGRGQFTLASLAKIVDLVNAEPGGLKSRFTHPSLSEDGLGKFLGRVSNARLEKHPESGIDLVRGDLQLDPTSFKTPSGDLGGYVLALANSDSEALSSSLVLTTKKEYVLNADGTRKTNDKGEPLPPIWHPQDLHASDIVDTGDAVDGLLSAGLSIDELPDAAVRRGAELLDRVFAGQTREVIEARAGAYLERYLNLRFGPDEQPPKVPDSAPPAAGTSIRRRRLELKQKTELA